MSQKNLPTVQVIQGYLTKSKDQIKAALPKHLSPDRMLRIALTEIRKNPDIQKCAPLSIIGSIIQASQLGLEPGSALGHCYLVPYKGECQIQIGYRGMIDLARRSNAIKSISARVVREGDTFEFEYGIEEKLVHKPATNGRGKIQYVYAVATFKDTGHQFEVMSLEEIEEVRRKSKSPEKGPWKDHFEEMAKKTVIRRLFKYLPVSIELQRAVGLDEQIDAGISQSNAEVMEPFPDTIETTATTTQENDPINDINSSISKGEESVRDVM